MDLAHRRRGLVATGKREHGVVLLTYDDSAFARSSFLLAGETDRLKLRFIAKPRSEVSWSFEVISPSAPHSLATKPNGMKFCDSLLFRLATNWLSYSVLYPLPIEFYYMTTLNRLGKES